MEYNYTRDLQANHEYNIGYRDTSFSLAEEIRDAFLGNSLDYVRCNGTQVKIGITPALTAGEKTTLDTLVQDHKNAFKSSSKIYKINGTSKDPSEVDVNLFGLHKKETIDSYGLLILTEYYKNYDGTTYSDLIVTDAHVYNIDINDLVTDRTETIKWYMIDDTVGYTKIITKYYDTISAIHEGMRRRGNLADEAKAYGMGAITGTHDVSGDPVMPNSHWFFMQLAHDVDLYIQGINKQGLIDLIQDSTDSYLTQTIKDDLEGILKYWT